MKPLKNSKYPLGQATIEYIFLMIFVVLIGMNLMKGLREFFGKQFGSFATVLSQHLNVGVCKKNCVYAGYANGQGK